MKRRPSQPIFLVFVTRLSLLGAPMGYVCFYSPYSAHAAEKQLSEKPASWSDAFSKASIQEYVVKKGDSLTAIAKNIFGDSSHWKTIWALNQNLISSPKSLSPGMKLQFQADAPPLPEQVRKPASSFDSGSSPFGHGRSTEWKRLPPQPWEHVPVSFPTNVDSSGFDLIGRLPKPNPKGFELQAIPASSLLPSKGTIFGSRTEGDYLSMNDIVYIQAEAPLKTGEVYAITQKPTLFTAKKPERFAYSYVILGKVKILGVKHHIFVGKVTSARYFIPRGSQLITAPPRFTQFEPVAGTHPTKGTLFLDHHFSTYTTAQHKEVFIDRGIVDGIQIGMIFRSYKHEDANTKKIVSKKNFIVDADILVTAVSENFCSGLIIKSTSPIQEGASLSLITDLALLKDKEFEEKEDIGSLPEDPEKLDTGEDEKLGVDDAQVLKQLETWKGNAEVPQNADSALTPPSDSPPLAGAEALPEDLPPPSDEAELPIGEEKAEGTGPISPEQANQSDPALAPLDGSVDLSQTAPPEAPSDSSLAPPPELTQNEDMTPPENLPPPEEGDPLANAPLPPELPPAPGNEASPPELQMMPDAPPPERSLSSAPAPVDPPFPELQSLPAPPQTSLLPPALPPTLPPPTQGLNLPPKSSESSLLPPPEESPDVLPAGLPLPPPNS